MSDSGNFLNKLKEIWQNCQPVLQQVGYVLGQIGKTLRLIGVYIYKLRSVFMAFPVAVTAIILALKNNQQLPEQVGITLLETGEFAQMVPRSVAVNGPLAFTALCLLMMFCSRKTLYPWLISVFSLVLPLVILFFNTYPT